MNGQTAARRMRGQLFSRACEKRAALPRILEREEDWKCGCAVASISCSSASLKIDKAA